MARRRRQTKPSGFLGLILIVGIVWAVASVKREHKPAPDPAPVEETPSSVSLQTRPDVPTAPSAVAPAPESSTAQVSENADPVKDTSEADSRADVLPRGPIDGPPRADSLIAAAEDLARAGKKAAAIEFYATVVKQYFGTKQAESAAGRILGLGGEVPVVAESDRWTPDRERARYPVVAARTTARTTARTEATEVPRYDPPPVWPSYDYNASRYSGYSSDQTVHVRGYFRKNGTYVQPHYRRPPRR